MHSLPSQLDDIVAAITQHFRRKITIENFLSRSETFVFHFLMKSFSPDLDSGPLAFLTVSTEEVGGGGQGNNPTLIPQLVGSNASRGQRERSEHDRYKRCLLGGALFNRIS